MQLQEYLNVLLKNSTKKKTRKVCKVEQLNVFDCHFERETLIRNMKFVLDEKLPQNTSKFAILLEYENPRRFFRFSFRATLSFSLMNALVYVDID